MQLTITRAQERALNTLRGTPDDVHMMLMTVRPTGDGAILQGTEETFANLVTFISDDIAEGMLAKKAIGPLSTLCIQIDPDCANWLGM